MRLITVTREMTEADLRICFFWFKRRRLSLSLLETIS